MPCPDDIVDWADCVTIAELRIHCEIINSQMTTSLTDSVFFRFDSISQPWSWFDSAEYVSQVWIMFLYFILSCFQKLIPPVYV